MSETLFKQVNYDLGGLMPYIDIGEIGLPDIQRSFVWGNAKVRNFFDNIHRALPSNWPTLKYSVLLEKRRDLVAGVISKGFSKLVDEDTGVKSDHVKAPASLVEQGETLTTEFKCAIRTNIHTGKTDPRIQWSFLRTIAGFLNQNGGTLVVGVTDEGEHVGLSADEFAEEDELTQYLLSSAKKKLGSESLEYIHPRIEDYETGRIMAVECWAARKPIYYNDENGSTLYVRSGVSTLQVPSDELGIFLGSRFSTMTN